MQPLDGLLVVAIEQAVAAPFCTARLVQAGARVIKVEREEGDFARGYDKAAKDESSYFIWLNQGKQSVCLDFKSAEGAQLLRNILKKADVLIQNLSPGALPRAGFSTKEMHDLNPKLIICNISGYGMEGEVSRKPAYDLLVQAESGLISVSGSSDAPGRIGVSVCDIGAGMTAYSGILEAIIKRSISGKGDEISISLFDVAADWMAVPFIHAEYGDGAPQPAGLRHPSIAPYGAFKCSDAKLVLISIQNEREWERFCKLALQSDELFENPNYKSNTLRVVNRDQLERDITDITSQQSSQELQLRLQKATIAYGALNEASDLRHHAAFRIGEYRTADGKQIELAAHPVKWTDPDTDRPMRSPKIGEHTEAIVEEFGD
jgi:crotonobetainyl-CoA:carnitine CoA-transferase CaiB-like acyl-CoA transferase